MEWISVEDRFPPFTKDDGYTRTSDFVLCSHVPDGFHMSAPKIWIFFLRQHKNSPVKWSFIGDLQPGKITHWMPLPEPPKEKE